MDRQKVLAIVGPTGIGKTSLSVWLAKQLDGEIISCDSMQVTQEEMQGIHHELIDVQNYNEPYNVKAFQEKCRTAIEDVVKRGKFPILCGGTGLYLESVLKRYRLSAVPENKELRTSLEGKTLAELTSILEELKRNNGSTMHNTTDVDTAQRAIRAIEIETFNGEHPQESADVPQIDSLVIGVAIDRETRREKISRRLKSRLQEGMVEEIRGLLDSGISPDDLIYYGLEYKYVTEYVIGRISLDEMFQRLEIAIHQFAKRQMTWFRGMERRGTLIHWIDSSLPIEDKIKQIKSLWK